METEEYYHVQKTPPLESFLSQINPVYFSTPYYLEIDSNVMLHLCLGLSSNLVHSDFLNKLVYVFLLFPLCWGQRLKQFQLT